MADAMVRELRDRLLRGEPVELSELQNLVQAKVPESLYLDYKRNDFLDKNGGAKLRKHVSAFANADGGLLVVGAADGPLSGETADVSGDAWTLTGCKAQQGRTELVSWANSVLRGLQGLPRWNAKSFELPSPGTDGRTVLAIAVERALLPVWTTRNGSPALYLRIGDHTIQADEWLVRDLFLGRRRTPHLITTHAESKRLDRGDINPEDGISFVQLRWSFRIHNSALAWGDDLHVMFIGRVVLRGGLAPPAPPLAQEIRDLTPTNFRADAPLVFGDMRIEFPGRPGNDTVYHRDISPLSVLQTRITLHIPRFHRSCWLGALCLLTRNDIPRWVQLGLDDTEAPSSPGLVQTLTANEQPIVFFGRDSDLSTEDLHHLKSLRARASASSAYSQTTDGSP